MLCVRKFNCTGVVDSVEVQYSVCVMGVCMRVCFTSAAVSMEE